MVRLRRLGGHQQPTEPDGKDSGCGGLFNHRCLGYGVAVQGDSGEKVDGERHLHRPWVASEESFEEQIL